MQPWEGRGARENESFSRREEEVGKQWCEGRGSQRIGAREARRGFGHHGARRLLRGQGGGGRDLVLRGVAAGGLVSPDVRPLGDEAHGHGAADALHVPLERAANKHRQRGVRNEPGAVT